MRLPKSKKSSNETLKAAKSFSRRTLLKNAAYGTVLAMGPWIVKDAFSSSGNLRIMIWSDFLPDTLSHAFIDATGIELNQTLYGSDEELLHRLKSSKGRGFDLVCPTVSHLGHWKDIDLLQPWDLGKVPIDVVEPVMLKASQGAGMWQGGLHHLPFVWGTEGLAWRTDKWFRDIKDLTYGDLWSQEMKGKIMGRAISLLVTLGLYLDRIGKVPSNRMLDAYKDEESMRRIWDQIIKFAVEHRSWVKLFWEDAEGQVSGFKHNGVILGQTWNGPPTRLRNSGEPIRYQAPVEGALAWLAGLSVPKGANNMDQVYEFVKYYYTAKKGARLGDVTGYSSCVVGADKHMKNKSAISQQEGALDKLWWWPAEEPWRAAVRDEYRDKFIAA